jgi:hypothetical protein
VLASYRAPSYSTPYRQSPQREQISVLRRSRPTVSAPFCRAVSTGSGSIWCPQLGTPNNQPQLGFRRIADRHRRPGFGFHLAMIEGADWAPLCDAKV